MENRPPAIVGDLQGQNIEKCIILIRKHTFVAITYKCSVIEYWNIYIYMFVE